MGKILIALLSFLAELYKINIKKGNAMATISGIVVLVLSTVSFYLVSQLFEVSEANIRYQRKIAVLQEMISNKQSKIEDKVLELQLCKDKLLIHTEMGQMFAINHVLNKKPMMSKCEVEKPAKKTGKPIDLNFLLKNIKHDKSGVDINKIGSEETDGTKQKN